MGFFLVLVKCCKKLKSTEEQLIIDLMQQENSLFDNLLGINLFSQWHCYMIIIIFC